MRVPQSNKYFPKDTYNILKSTDIQQTDNFYYLFNTPRIAEKEENKMEIKINEKIQEFKWDTKFINYLIDRRISNIKKLDEYVKEIEAKLRWRLVVGLSGIHPQETSMTLHHIYGIPYIPGSAVKGITRQWIILKNFDGKEENALRNEEFKNIFGTQQQAGKIVFMDAYPVGDIKLSIDIMNPHYPDYYTNPAKNPPADWQSPTPIKFLTVKDTKFKFHLLSKDENLLEKACEWLKDAITHYGVGAKTALGYGIFTLQ